MESLGRRLLRQVIPADIPLPDELTGSNVSKLYEEVARRYPERYGEITKQLNKLAVDGLFGSDVAAFRLEDLKPPPALEAIRKRVWKKAEEIYLSGGPDADERFRKWLESEAASAIDTAYEIGKQSNNAFWRHVASGARGNKAQLKRLILGDITYYNNKGEPIPFPATTPFTSGTPLAEYWAATYGARKGLVDTKLGVRQSGYMEKLLNHVSHKLIVRTKDDPNRPQNVGLPVAVDDSDNIGACLAQDYGPYKANTVITEKILGDLKNMGLKKILVRSPITSTLGDGLAVYDVGVRESGRLADIGSLPGLTAAQAIGERLAQTSLSSKHTGGAAKMSGFAAIQQLLTIPKRFRAGAVHTDVDGIVSDVKQDELGGWTITIGDKQFVAPPGYTPLVRKGDRVEAGDTLTEGLPNPADIVRHKGTGEGRRYFTDIFVKAMKDAGLPVHRRNVELLARGLIDHVTVTEAFDGFSVGDTVPFSYLQRRWQPRKGAQNLPVEQAEGWYLEQPVLHYTVGTKIRPSLLRELKEFGVSSVLVHREPPPFEPFMVRATANLEYDPNWVTRLWGGNQLKNILRAAQSGASASPYDTSFVSAKAMGIPLTEWVKQVTKT